MSQDSVEILNQNKASNFIYVEALLPILFICLPLSRYLEELIFPFGIVLLILAYFRVRKALAFERISLDISREELLEVMQRVTKELYDVHQNKVTNTLYKFQMIGFRYTEDYLLKIDGNEVLLQSYYSGVRAFFLLFKKPSTFKNCFLKHLIDVKEGIPYDIALRIKRENRLRKNELKKGQYLMNFSISIFGAILIYAVLGSQSRPLETTIPGVILGMLGIGLAYYLKKKKFKI
ncbi:hypothetical protein KMW28_03570 [Flammeovirga yaeyamensis]|uniref:Uncharacterized protein n=1 Tax=Flammeovirga yaeyamensis TaxID=367791 RepID=A0AAX1N5G2_9BACT|nr:hypothetical protein [Flammeovirga yaeyamensis]MBB3701274.1 hypothetical protein [Flammeovirga yaeyamensis]NMF38256.1 hypothetical protein [Flammeovirga yaeyamensis]QWG02667.1 hypothetical protein KMW28_03570 [Flammeovirga yaeyamensis]